MIAKFLKIFGYVKVPREAILLSRVQESYFKTLMVRGPSFLSESSVEVAKKQLAVQEALTRFLRTGKFYLEK